MQRDNRRDKIITALAATGLPIHQLFFTWRRNFDAAAPMYSIFAHVHDKRAHKYSFTDHVVWECDTLDECYAVRQEMRAVAVAAEKFMLSLPDQ